MGVQIQSPRWSFKLIMMLLLLLLTTSPWLARAGNPKPLGQGTGNDQYKPVDPSYSTPDEGYKAGDKDDCHPVEEIVYENQCIPYVEKTCRTSQKEMCKDVYEKNCTAVIDEFEERECFDVTELFSAKGRPPRSATTPPGRSRRRSASPRPASTARSSPTSSPSPWRSRTATPSP